MTMKQKKAVRRNLEKARVALAEKRAHDKQALLPQAAAAFASLAATTPSQALASDDVTIQTLQAALDQAGWQLSVLGHRLKGLL